MATPLCKVYVKIDCCGVPDWEHFSTDDAYAQNPDWTCMEVDCDFLATTTTTTSTTTFVPGTTTTTTTTQVTTAPPTTTTTTTEPPVTTTTTTLLPTTTTTTTTIPLQHIRFFVCNNTGANTAGGVQVPGAGASPSTTTYFTGGGAQPSTNQCITIFAGANLYPMQGSTTRMIIKTDFATADLFAKIYYSNNNGASYTFIMNLMLGPQGSPTNQVTVDIPTPLIAAGSVHIIQIRMLEVIP